MTSKIMYSLKKDEDGEYIRFCDFCNSKSSYDGKTIYGPWANMCEQHFSLYGIGLGLGKGQKIKENLV